MPSFGKRSTKVFNSVNDDLRRVFYEVIKEVDCAGISGLRTAAEQQILFAQGRTMPGPIVTNCDGLIRLSNHQSETGVGNAVDVIPWPVYWNDTKRFYHFIGFVRGVAFQLGIDIVSGSDWDSDYILSDQDFYDLPHFESRTNT